MKNLKSFNSYVNENFQDSTAATDFLKKLKDKNYKNIISDEELFANGVLNIVSFDNPEGSHFELVIEPDGEVSGDCTSIASGDPCDFLETHMGDKTNIKDFPFDDLLDW